MLSPSDVVETCSLGGEATYLKLKDGRELVLKGVPRQERASWQPGTPWTELQALDILSAAGAPVPKLVAADPQAGWLMNTFLPGRPLGEVLPVVGDAAFPALVAGLTQIERILSAYASELTPHTADDAPSAWFDMAKRMESLLTSEAAEAWAKLIQDVLDPAALTLGPLDIHAGNAIWHRDQVYFIDFATAGPDFPERRLAAYGQAVSPQVASALTPAAYASYVEAAGHKAGLRLAVFDLLFWGVVLSRLRAGDPNPLREWALAQWRRDRLPDGRLAIVIEGLR